MRNAALFTAALSLAAVGAVADEVVTHSFSSAAKRGAIRRVIVDIPAGEVQVRNGVSDAITLTGEVRRGCDDRGDREKNQRIVDDISAEIYVSGDEAIVRRKFGPNAQSWSARSWHSSYHVTVEVPRGIDVVIETRYGEVKMEGDFGNVDIDLRAGEVHLRTPRASVHELNASVRVGEVHTDLGEQRESHEGIFPGSTHFINSGGRTRINVHTTVGELHVTLTR
jgi:hypothetical protein